MAIRWFIFGVIALLVNSAFAEKAKKNASTSSSRPVGKSEEGDYIVEKRSDGTVVKYKKKTSYDFEGTGIEGLYNKPSGAYISNIKQVKGKSIIRMRENFDAEVIDSSRLLK
jgi:hypothetical protein